MPVHPALVQFQGVEVIMECPLMGSPLRLEAFMLGHWDLFRLDRLALRDFSTTHGGFVPGREPSREGRKVLWDWLSDFFLVASVLWNPECASVGGEVWKCLHSPTEPA
jgi:hypothetical protein